MQLPITKRRIRNHLTYAWWQYMVLVAAAIFGWNLIYTTTRYRSPESLKVEWYGEGLATLEAQSLLDGLMDELHETLFPDMEEVGFTSIVYDQTYGSMQIMIWLAAGQGDLYMLEASRFQSVAGDGTMIDLQPYIDDGTLNVDGIDLTNGYVANTETGQTALLGIPTDSLTWLKEYGVAPNGMVLSVLANGGNIDNTLLLLQWILQRQGA